MLFTKGLFSISLCTNNNLLQYNVFRPGMDFIKVRSTHSWVEADIEKGIFPVAFWDGVYLMVQGLRKKLFPKECAELASACDLLFDAINRHRKNPSMSTLVMLRALRDYIQKKAPHYLEVRRKKNRENQHIYEKMLKLVQGAPHSLNTLRALNLPMEIKKVGNSYWEVSVLDGEFMERGNNLVSTAAIVMRQYRKFQRTAV